MTDTIHGNASGLKVFHQIKVAGALGIECAVEFVDEQQGVRINLSCSLKCYVNVLRPNDVVPGTATQAVWLSFVDDFIDNIPGVELRSEEHTSELQSHSFI